MRAWAANFLLPVVCMTSFEASSQTSIKADHGQRVDSPDQSLITTFRNANIYAYSFLSANETSIGHKYIAEVERQFVEMLTSNNVRTSLVSFTPSEIAITQPKRSYEGDTEITEVQVGAMIAPRSASENPDRPRYRLIIFPVRSGFNLGNEQYDIRWALIDPLSGREIWACVTHSKHNVFLPEDFDATGRARKTIAALKKEMQRAGLL